MEYFGRTWRTWRTRRTRRIWKKWKISTRWHPSYDSNTQKLYLSIWWLNTFNFAALTATVKNRNIRVWRTRSWVSTRWDNIKRNIDPWLGILITLNYNCNIASFSVVRRCCGFFCFFVFAFCFCACAIQFFWSNWFEGNVAMAFIFSSFFIMVRGYIVLSPYDPIDLRLFVSIFLPLFFCV